MKEITIFERSNALVRDLELERGGKRRRIVQYSDVRDVHCTHCTIKAEESTVSEYVEIETLGFETFIELSQNPS